MRKTHEGEEAGKVYDAFRSHAAIARKNRLLLTLLDDIRRANAEVSQPPPPPPGLETPSVLPFARGWSARCCWCRLIDLSLWVLSADDLQAFWAVRELCERGHRFFFAVGTATHARAARCVLPPSASACSTHEFRYQRGEKGCNQARSFVCRPPPLPHQKTNQ